jgi:protein O-mannosyl-transferase
MSRRAKSKLRGELGAAASGSVASASRCPARPDVQTYPRWLSFAVCLFLALAVWAVFGQTLHHEFVNSDDERYVYENRTVAQGISLKGIEWAMTYGKIGHWHPLTWVSHMLDCQLYGLHPGGHHLTNVLLHAATAMLLFLVLRKMTGALWRSAFVAAVFAIHPLRVESVAWVSERKDVLSGLFFMLTLFFYTRFAQATLSRTRNPNARPGENGSGIWGLGSRDYWLAVVFFALGLLSKSMLVTLPFVLLLLDWWPLKRFTIYDLRFTISNLVGEKVPFFLLSAAAGVATSLVPEVVSPADKVSFSLRMGNALVSYLAYMGHMIWPAKLAIPYLFPASGRSWGEAAMALALLVAISLVAIAWWQKRPYFVVGWLWYLGMLVPVIGLVQISYYARADRYTYLPQIGLYVLVAWGAVELFGGWRYRRAVLGCSSAVILAGLAACAYVQTGYWKDSVSLWTHTLACVPGNYYAHNNLGGALADRGRYAEAIAHYEQALQLKPDDAKAHLNLGGALARQGRLPEAVEHFERAVQLQPDFAGAYINLGNALAAQGKLAEAIEHYNRALQLRPDDAKAHLNLGNALARQGKLPEAVEHFERALQLRPDDAQILNNLGNAFAAQRKLVEAIDYYQRALRLKPDNVQAHYNLGNVLASQGKLTEAISHLQQALDMATAQGNLALAESIRTRLGSLPPALPQPQTP